MTDLDRWFAAQLDADEQTARAATAGPWTARNWDRMIPADRAGHTIRNQDGQYAVAPGHDDGGAIGAANAEHIARHDPAFVLADITAKRRILAEHATQDVPILKFRGELIMSGPECRVCADWDAAEMDGPPNAPAPCQTLRLLAAAYASRPGYDPTWAPEQPAHNTAGDTT